MNKPFWNSKVVLITGFEGFLGSHLTKALLKTHAKIVGLDIKTHRSETVLRSCDYKSFTVYQGSVTNRKILRKILHQHAVDIIFHLAAEATVGRSQRDPLRAFTTNIAGTWNLLEAARLYGNIEALVVASSDKAYGSHITLPYREEAPLVAHYPYDVSKSCADLIANTYALTYGLPVAITRCGNIYGPGDFTFSRIVPDAYRCLMRNKAFKIRSDGSFIRDYVYIDDIVAGYLRIAELVKKRKFCGETFNLSDEKPVAVLQLLKQIEQSCPLAPRLSYQIMNTARHEIKRQYLSSSKARRILGWKPRYGLAQGLRKAARWYWQYFHPESSL